MCLHSSFWFRHWVARTIGTDTTRPAAVRCRKGQGSRFEAQKCRYSLHLTRNGLKVDGYEWDEREVSSIFITCQSWASWHKSGVWSDPQRPSMAAISRQDYIRTSNTWKFRSNQKQVRDLDGSVVLPLKISIHFVKEMTNHMQNRASDQDLSR